MNVRLSIIVAAFLLLSCASTQRTTKTSTVIDSGTTEFSAAEFVKTCPVPDEQYFIRQLNAKVLRNKNCMAIDDLLTVIFTGELTNAAKDGAALLVIGYTTRLAKMNPGMEYNVRPLGVDSFRHRDTVYHMSFFELRHRNEN